MVPIWWGSSGPASGWNQSDIFGCYGPQWLIFSFSHSFLFKLSDIWSVLFQYWSGQFLRIPQVLLGSQLQARDAGMLCWWQTPGLQVLWWRQLLWGWVPSSTCSFANEPVTPYYWDPLCRMGMLGCNADAIHVQCRFCDYKPFHSVRCPDRARPPYPDGKCWFPHGTSQSYKWDPTCKWGKTGCWADGVNAYCRYCGPGSGGVYEGISCTENSLFP